MRRTRRGERGFTIVELLVAMTLVTVLIGVAFQIGIIVVTGYRQHREATSVQRAARGSLDLIADAVRNGSAGVPTGQLQDASGCSDFTAIDVQDNSDGPDELRVITAAGGVVTSLRTDFDESMTEMTVVNGAGIAAGDLLLITDFTTGHVVKVAAAPTQDGDYWDVSTEAVCGGSFAYKKGNLVLRARVSRFYIEDVDGVPTMFLDIDDEGDEVGEPLAEGIEDFQVAVAVDGDSDGNILDTAATDDEWYGNAEGDGDPPGIMGTPWRALRMTVVARSVREDAAGDWSTPVTVENHEPNGTADGFRRRMVKTIVEIRNLTGSP